MKFYGITMQGKFINQTLATVPLTFDPATDVGRLIYNIEDGYLWWGDGEANIWRSIGEGGGDNSEHEDMYSDLLMTSIFLNCSWNEFWQNMGNDEWIDESLSTPELADNWNGDLKAYYFNAVGQSLVSSNLFDQNLAVANAPYAMPSVFWWDGTADGLETDPPLIYLNCTDSEANWEGPCTNNDVWRFANTPTNKHVRMKIVSTGSGHVLSWGLYYHKDLSVSCSKYALTQFEIIITDPIIDNPIVVDYIPGYVLVFLNGVLLQDEQDFTATDGQAILIHQPDLEINDVINVISFGTSTFSGGGDINTDLFIRKDGAIDWDDLVEQSVGNGKFINLGIGVDPTDSVNMSQLDETAGSSPNRHARLYDAATKLTVVANTDEDGVDGHWVTFNDHKIKNIADGNVSVGSQQAVNGRQLYDHQELKATTSVWGHVKVTVSGGVMTITGG